ncbi:hypothetical protein D9M68_500110 [compost metagenome]
MAHAARHHVALEVEAARGLRAALVLAAEVVHVEGAVGAVAVVVAFGAATEGVGQPVVGLQALLADLRAPAPVGIQCLAEAHRAGQRLEHRGLRPRLVVEVDARIDRRGQHAAQQAVAVLARLCLAALLDLEFEHRVARDAPVGREREQVAVAVEVVGQRLEVFAGHVEPIAELAVLAEAAAEVDRAEHTAAARGFETDRAQVLFGRALDHVVDEPARRAGAGLDAAGAAQDLDALLVVQRDRRLGADRQAFAPVVEAVVEHEAAHREVVPVAGRVVGVGDRGVELRQVGEAARAAAAQLLAVDDRGRQRQLAQRHVAEAADVGLWRGGAVVHGDLGQGLRLRLRMRAASTESEKGGGKRARKRGGREKSSVHSVRSGEPGAACIAVIHCAAVASGSSAATSARTTATEPTPVASTSGNRTASTPPMPTCG